MPSSVNNKNSPNMQKRLISPEISFETLLSFLSFMLSDARLKELIGQIHRHLAKPDLEQLHADHADNNQALAVFRDRVNELLADVARKDRQIAELTARLEGL
ncbi:hypothetical protein HDU90_008594 [Geranomyces variabilis]|nr:hypothetical protein HDU90_008594 [Geranomyces variabilis]